jgi:hypothetical protein
MVMDLSLGDVVRLRKPHPCGGLEWEVVRLGADIRIRCRTCDRPVMLARSELKRRTKSVVSARRTLAERAV